MQSKWEKIYVLPETKEKLNSIGRMGDKMDDTISKLIKCYMETYGDAYQKLEEFHKRYKKEKKII
jgi:hypothetical protein